MNNFKGAFPDADYFFENLMVALTMNMRFPFLKTPEILWNSYVELCRFYSLFKFAAVMCCRDKAEKERVFYAITKIGVFLHSQNPKHNYFNASNLGSELADMAILIKG